MVSNELPRCLSKEIRREIETKRQHGVQKNKDLCEQKGDEERYTRQTLLSVCVWKRESWKSPATGHALNS